MHQGNWQARSCWYGRPAEQRIVKCTEWENRTYRLSGGRRRALRWAPPPTRHLAAAVAVPRLWDVRDTDSDDVTELVERGTLLAIVEELMLCVATTNGQDAGGGPSK